MENNNEKKIETAVREAIREAREGVEAGHGGPFGAAVIRDGEIVALAHNTVLLDSDPTAHAEINAIRLAGRNLGTHELHDCILVATSEPCPMCLAGSYWAGVKEVIYVLPRETAEAAGFRDIAIDEDIAKPVGERHLPLVHCPEFSEEAERNFELWSNTGGNLY